MSGSRRTFDPLIDLAGLWTIQLAAAASGTRLESDRPFPISFDPAELLEP